MEEDFDYYYKWRNDPNVFKYLGGGYKIVSKDKMKEIFTNLLKPKSDENRFTIINENNTPIGMIGLYNISEKNKNAEIGMYIGDVNSRGKGYAQEAFDELRSIAKNQYGLIKLKLYVVKKNYAAVKLWKRLGFIESGILKSERLIDNSFHDVLYMEKFI